MSAVHQKEAPKLTMSPSGLSPDAQQPWSWGNKLSPPVHCSLFLFIFIYIYSFLKSLVILIDTDTPVVSCLSQDQHFPLVELNSSFSQDKHSLYYCMKPLPSVWGTVKLFFFLFELEIEPRAMYMVGQLSIAELHIQPFYKCFYQQFL